MRGEIPGSWPRLTRERGGADRVRQSIALDLDPGATSGVMLPELEMRTFGIVAQVNIGRPLGIGDSRGIGPRHRRVAAIGELDMVAGPAIGAGDEQHRG